MSIFSSFLDLLFPPKCPFCGRVLDSVGICPKCEKELLWTNDTEALREDVGGLCCAAPLWYEDLAREGLLRFKFHGASGAAELFSRLCAPMLELLGIPAETAPLMLIRPVSGSGALAVGTELMTTYGPDSLIGRVAAVMLGSTETTFYTIAVYFGSAGIRKTRHAVPAALIADFTGFAVSAWAVRWLFT